MAQTDYIERRSVNFTLRSLVTFVLFACCFLLLVLRLWYLQILRGDHFRGESENNRLRRIYVPPPRGTIFDRNGAVLARNRPAFNVDLLREDCPDPARTIEQLAEISGIDSATLIERSRLFERKRRRFEPKLLLRDIPRDLVARIEAHRYLLPGVLVNAVPAREYVHGSVAAHVLGYIKEINSEQLASPEYVGYRAGDLVGQAGIERSQELLLHGKRGLKKVIVNAVGIRRGDAFYQQERMGHNVTLTIDIELQKVAEAAFGRQSGALVALDPNTSEVLAMVSRPAYDPNDLVGEFTPSFWRDLALGDERRLHNRAMQGVYPLGSVFKIMMAVAGLAEGVIHPDENIYCGGSYRVGRSRPFLCWKRGGHGSIKLRQALQQSCNVYFYTLGQRLGIDRIHEYATRFGFGRATGIDLGFEQSGLVPSRAWKKKINRHRDPSEQRWYAGETPSVSIGQGALTVTPLQVAQAVAAVVNGGRILRPYLVRRVAAQDGSYNDQFEPHETGRLDVEEWILAAVRDGLTAVVNEPGGTGGRVRLGPEFGEIKVAGKTGTAQRRSSNKPGEPLEDNAWFAAYAPTDKPQIVVVALVVGGGHGGSAAAPVARQVFEQFFRSKGMVIPAADDESPR